MTDLNKFLQLPNELQASIIQKLPPLDILRYRLVNRHLNQVICYRMNTMPKLSLSLIITESIKLRRCQFILSPIWKCNRKYIRKVVFDIKL